MWKHTFTSANMELHLSGGIKMFGWIISKLKGLFFLKNEKDTPTELYRSDWEIYKKEFFAEDESSSEAQR